MEKQYYLCEWNYGYTGQFYQEVENGIVVRFVDLNGAELPVAENFGYDVINKEPFSNLFI